MARTSRTTSEGGESAVDLVVYLWYSTDSVSSTACGVELMDSRRFVVAATIGSALGGGIFFLVLDRSLTAERWGRVAVSAAAFGLFMALWNGVLIRLDSRQRTVRNIVFEHAVGEFVSVMGVAWALVASLERMSWQDLTWYTVIALPFLFLVYLVTRKNIKGQDPSELLA